jgi:hypothetical protein
MGTALLVGGILSLVIGACLGVWKKKRKFDRTNKSGVEQFPSFSGKASARLLDGILFLSSAALLFAGLLMISLRYEDTFGWLVLIPVYALALFVVI